MTDDQILDAAEIYEAERSLWMVRNNKSVTPVRYEIIRRPDDSDPVVMASTTGKETAIYEMEGMRMMAAMKAALAYVKSPKYHSSATRGKIAE